MPIQFFSPRFKARPRCAWTVQVLVITALVGFATFQFASAGKPAAPPPTICYLALKSNFGTTTTAIRGTTETGGSPVTIASKNVHPWAVPRWSPNRQRILYLKQSTPDTLVTCAADGTGGQAIVNTDQVWAFIGLTHPSAYGTFNAYDWSPDGQWIVFDFGVVYNSYTMGSRLFLVRISDGLLWQLTDDNIAESHYIPRWSRSLNMLSYLRSPDGGGDEERELWVMAPDGTGRRQIIGPYSPTVLSTEPANWSNSGDPLTGKSSLLFKIAGSSPAIVDINLSAIDPVESIQVLTASGSWPAWSPDDTKIILMGGVPGVSQIVTYDLIDGTTKVIAQSTTESLRYPDWRASP